MNFKNIFSLVVSLAIFQAFSMRDPYQWPSSNTRGYSDEEFEVITKSRQKDINQQTTASRCTYSHVIDPKIETSIRNIHGKDAEIILQRMAHDLLTKKQVPLDIWFSMFQICGTRLDSDHYDDLISTANNNLTLCGQVISVQAGHSQEMVDFLTTLVSKKPTVQTEQPSTVPVIAIKENNAESDNITEKASPVASPRYAWFKAKNFDAGLFLKYFNHVRALQPSFSSKQHALQWKKWYHVATNSQQQGQLYGIPFMEPAFATLGPAHPLHNIEKIKTYEIQLWEKHGICCAVPIGFTLGASWAYTLGGGATAITFGGFTVGIVVAGLGIIVVKKLGSKDKDHRDPPSDGPANIITPEFNKNNALGYQNVITESMLNAIKANNVTKNESNRPVACGGAGDPEDPNDPDKNKNKNKNRRPDFEDPTKNKIDFFKKNESHIFRNDEGHLLDTPENRRLLIEMTSDPKNFLGPDERGNLWYGKILPDGKQVWTSVRDNLIRNGGLNETPKIFNSKTGLCSLGKK